MGRPPGKANAPGLGTEGDRQNAATLSIASRSNETSTCPSCGGELYQLLDGFDACRRCGVRQNEGRVLAELLEDTERFARRFVSFQNEHQSCTAALWVGHVFAIDAAPAAAYIRIASAVEESGKTTLCEVFQELVRNRGINAVSVTPASVFRAREKRGPVALILDEIDNTLRDRKDDGARDLLAIVNAGYRSSFCRLRWRSRSNGVRSAMASPWPRSSGRPSAGSLRRPSDDPDRHP